VAVIYALAATQGSVSGVCELTDFCGFVSMEEFVDPVFGENLLGRGWD
jgi:hypothetical protein